MSMRKHDEIFWARVNEIVSYFNENESTVRKTAKQFGVSKSIVHYYLTRLRPNAESKRILEKNKAERHIRGGLSTKNKYLSLKRS